MALRAWVLLAAICLGGPAYGQVPASPDEIRTKIVQAVKRGFPEHQVLVAPAVIDGMVASASIFVGNFCVPPTSSKAVDRCNRTINDPKVLTPNVIEYLKEVTERRPPSLLSLGARLARSLGENFGMIGWPENVDNSIAVIMVEGDWRALTFALQTQRGLIELGKGARAILVTPGVVGLGVMSADAGTTLTLSLSPREATAIGNATERSRETIAAGRIEPSSDLFCYSTPPVPNQGPLAYFHWGRGWVQARAQEANLASFGRQVAFDIRVVDEAGACDEICMKRLSAAFAQAISVWRGGCARCDPNAMSVLKVGDDIWVDWRISERLRLRQMGSDNVSLDLRRVRNEELGRTVAAPWVDAATNGAMPFDEISSDQRREICGLNKGAAPWVEDAQALVCGGAPRNAPMRPVLTIKRGATSCGPTSTFVACGLPGAGIEITVGNDQYRFTGEEMLALGPGGVAVEMGPLILHEVGHWFGVPHSDIAGDTAFLDVMGSTYGDGPMCVSAHSLVMMNNGADIEWPYRVTEGGGLRWPRRGSN